MKKSWIGLAMILVLIADAFLKIYVERSAFFSPFFRPLFVAATVVMVLALTSLLISLRSKAGDPATESDSFEIPIPRLALIVGSVLFFGALVRFWRLDSLFVGFFLDEAYNGLDVIAIREMGARPLFLAWNSGREALIAYLDAISTVFFGYTGFAIRAVTAFAGTLTLVCFFFLIKRIFSTKMAMVCVFLLAVSKYAIIYNRFGLRINLMLFFEVASLCFLAYGMKSEKRNTLYFAAAGIFGGLGFHSYIPYRIFPLVWLAFLLDPGIRPYLRKRIKGLAIATGICILTVAPLALHFLRNPDDFTGRMKRTGVLSQQKEPAAKLLWQSTKDTFGLFIYRSDPNARHNVSEEPGLSPFSTGFFLIGIVMMLTGIRRPFSLFVLTYFLVTILPGILGAAAPHASRNLGALPPALIFSSAGLFAVIDTLAANRRTLKFAILALVLGGNLLTGVNDALFRYSSILDAQPTEESSLWGMNSAETEVAHYLNNLEDRYNIYLSPQLFFHATIPYLTHGRSSHRLLTESTELTHEKQNLLVFQLTKRNMWWMRDDDTKNFFHFWSEYRDVEVPYARATIRRTYRNNPHMMRASDDLLLAVLHNRYPSGKMIHFDQFSVYITR